MNLEKALTMLRNEHQIALKQVEFLQDRIRASKHEAQPALVAARGEAFRRSERLSKIMEELTPNNLKTP